MFWKNKKSTESNESRVEETTSTKQLPENLNHSEDEPTNTVEKTTEIPNEYQLDLFAGVDEQFSAEINLDDIGQVNQIDEEALRDNLTELIKTELRNETSVEEVEKKAEIINEVIGITEAEWQQVYNNVQLVGYEDRQQQATVYKSVLPEKFNPFEDTILDVGCGVGDLFAYIQEVLDVAVPKYTGIDLDPDMFELAKKKFPEANIYNQTLNAFTTEGKHDWVVAMSAFNEKSPTPFVITQTITEMYNACNKGISLNLMYEYPNPEASEHMVTYKPTDIAEWAFANFKNVKIHKGYIDRDFILTIEK